MLDLKTVLIVILTASSLQAAAWFAVWRAWRHLYELKYISAGFFAIAAAALMFFLRGEQPALWQIVVSNLAIKFGLVLLADGLARFLGQPRYRWIGISLLASQAVILTAAAVLDPGNFAIRLHTSTLFTVVMMSVMCLGLLRDRSQPTLLRWIMIALLAEYMGASILHSALEFRWPSEAEGASVLTNRNAWYLLQGALFAMAFVACLLFMVGVRLSTELRDKNDALLREIEERRKLEGMLNVSLDAERRLREEQADFMRVVSHEFRTPLAVIRNGVDMIGLTGDTLPDTVRGRLSNIRVALDRLFSVIDRFMAEDREGSFEPEPMQTGPLLAEVRLHFEMTGHGDRLHFSVEDEAVSFYADPDMLATVLINLIDNALKYSPDHQPVHVATREEHGSIVIEVHDHGMGIPEAELGHIGRRFFRASNAKVVTGTGLGLYSARRLLAYHRGTLQLEANDKGGMTAVARVPRSSDGADGHTPGRIIS
jgi:signal transduction histidine kinase